MTVFGHKIRPLCCVMAAEYKNVRNTTAAQNTHLISRKKIPTSLIYVTILREKEKTFQQTQA